MEKYNEIEVFKIETNKQGASFAWISYNDPEWKGDDPTNGYKHVKVPVNLRDIQYSIRGNTLVDQSNKDYHSVQFVI